MNESMERPGAYFVTAVTHQRRRLFQTDKNAQLMWDVLQHYRRMDKYLLHAFVIMPDHVHLLLTPKESTVERCVGMIKGGFSYRLKSAMPVWQTGYQDHRCRDADEFVSRKEYIHRNPVRAGDCV